MPLNAEDFSSIRTFIERVVGEFTGRRDEFHLTSRVMKNDKLKKLVWVAELGDQPIPIVGFDYTVKYYSVEPTGSSESPGISVSLGDFRTLKKTAKAEVVVPAVGEIVFIVLERGSKKLPRCLGKIQGRDWMTSEDD
jgi:hypothetical protein